MAESDAAVVRVVALVLRLCGKILHGIGACHGFAGRAVDGIEIGLIGLVGDVCG